MKIPTNIVPPTIRPFFLCLLFGLVSCAFWVLTQNILAGAPIKVGLEQNPPLSFINDQGKPDGILIDILTIVADQEGWQLEFVPNTLDKCLDSLKNNEIDLMVTIAYSKQRAKLYDFNKINVIANWGQIYIPTRSSVQSYFDLAEKRIAVIASDTHHLALHSMLDQFGIQAHYLPVDNFDAVFRLVDSGQADAGVVGRFFALQNEDHYPDLKASPIVFNPIEVRYAVPKGTNDYLLAALDKHLKILQEDAASLYYQSLERWLGLTTKQAAPKWVVFFAWAAAGIILALLFLTFLLGAQVKARTNHLRAERQERGKAEESRQQSEHKYSELVNNANSIILRMDAQGRIIFFNEFAEKFFGFRQAEIIGRRVIGAIVPAHDSLGQDMEQMIQAICLTPEAFINNENENIRKNGERIWISWTNKPLYAADGSLENILCVGTDVTARREYEAQLLHQTTYDQLTGLPNRNLLSERIRQAMTTDNRQQKDMAILLLDLDNFKLINDTIGHTEGDLLLQAVAERLHNSLGHADTVARLGGDEFVVWQDNLLDKGKTVHLAEDILALFTTPFQVEGKDFFISVSIGIALYPEDGQSIDLLLKYADVAMYHAKNQGKNNYQFFTRAINQELHTRMETEHLLRRALERDEFLVYYQPQVNVLDRTIFGMEALIRWQPATDLVPPAEFIPILEETGMILGVGEWVLTTACNQAKQWLDAGWPPFVLSVNISARQFQQPDLDTRIIAILTQTGFPAQHLCLELTESVIMENSAEILRKMHALRSLGIQLAIDDFGTGYSSLNYLQHMPISQLKIDRSFIADNPAPDQQNAPVIVDTILSMARCLGMEVIAEGVETSQQLDTLVRQNCHQIQGFFFSRPLSADELTRTAMPGGALRTRIEELFLNMNREP
jgi:diguanylate cyclase (GGDEF)-like protein/PAS domain S-box-containing protein